MKCTGGVPRAVIEQRAGNSRQACFPMASEWEAGGYKLRGYHAHNHACAAPAPKPQPALVLLAPCNDGFCP